MEHIKFELDHIDMTRNQLIRCAGLGALSALLYKLTDKLLTYYLR